MVSSVHMWVEETFEIFAAVIVACLYRMLPSSLAAVLLEPCLMGQHWSSSRILFCVPHAFRPEDWSPPLVTTAPWSLNGDIALTMAETASVG